MYKPATKLIICSVLLSGSFAIAESNSSTDINTKISDLSQEITKLQQEVNSLSSQKEPENFLGVDKEGAYSTAAVTTSPTLGIRSQHHGADLVVNFSTMNEDVRLLEQREAFQKQREQDELSKPLLELSGVLRGTVYYTKSITGLSNTDIDFQDTELDAFAEVSRMVSGFFSFAYDKGEPGYSISSIEAGNGYHRIDWSNVYLKRGFITIGDFTKSNWYGSIGQMYVPFGKFSSFQVSSTLVNLLGKTRSRALDIGYRTKNVIATAYALKGTTYVGGHNPAINTWGANIQRSIDLSNGRNITLGAGYISNIADSTGILDVLNTLHHATYRYKVGQYMPAYDVYAKLSSNDWVFNAEYINARKDLISHDVSYGKPSGVQIELDRMFKIGSVPASLAIGYGHISDFSMMPEDSYAVSLNTYLFKDTVQSLEFRHITSSKDADVEHTVVDKNSVTAVFSMYF